MRTHDFQQTHKILLLGYPSPHDATDISERNHRFRERASLKGYALRAELLHITFFCLGEYVEGEMPEELIPNACRAAARVVSPPIDIVLDRLQSFRRNSPDRPGVLTGSSGVEGLRRFRETLGLQLIGAGLKPFVKSSFTPHMTLFYDSRVFPPRAIAPVRWRMSEFVLVDSLRGQITHVPLARWQLLGEPNG